MTTPMSPDRFRAALGTELADRPTGVSTAESVAGDLLAGRRLLRRRRLTLAAGGVATACVVATVFTAVGLSGSGRAVDPAQEGSSVERTCLTANIPQVAARALGSDPMVKGVESTEVSTLAVLESADGRYWAECTIDRRHTDETSTVTLVYDSTDRSRGWTFSTGSGCHNDDGRVDRGCRWFTVQWTDRFPDEVGAVSFETSDGETTLVQVVDGYLVLNYRGRLPASVQFTPTGGTGRWSALHQVTYLDQAGDPIAAERFDGTGTGPQRQHVEGLPELRSVPSLRDSVSLGYR